VDGLHREIDRPIATLIRDLEQRGLLDRTLVIVASEFSRDALIEGRPGSTAGDQATFKVDRVEEMKHYGLHRHFTGGSSVVLFGGGVKAGHVHGETAAERPLVAIKDPVSVMDLHATIMTTMGISPKTEFAIEGRPFYVTEDGKGRAVTEIFA
jgi:arylsulfatase A-like enzyme